MSAVATVDPIAGNRDLAGIIIDSDRILCTAQKRIIADHNIFDVPLIFAINPNHPFRIPDPPRLQSSGRLDGVLLESKKGSGIGGSASSTASGASRRDSADDRTAHGC